MATEALSFGSIYFSTPAMTTLTGTTPAKAAGTTTTMQLGDFLHPSNNRLTYDGVTTRIFEVLFTGSAQKGSGGSADTFYYLYKDGVLIPGATVSRKIPNVGDEGAFGILAQVTLASGSYVELWLSTENGDDLQIDYGVLTAKVLG